MSNTFSWDDNEPFRDIPPEVSEQGAEIPDQFRNQPRQPSPRPQRPVQRPIQQPVQQEYMEEIVEQYAPDTEEEDYAEVLSDAHLRLESGRLYKLLMDHNIFEDAQGDTKAIQSVQREIRKFAKERMEVMLGMRAETTRQSTVVSSPFNDLEVTLLKELTHRMSDGKTSQADANKHVNWSAPKKEGLKTISSGVPAQQKSLSKPTPRPLNSSPLAPIQRQAPQQQPPKDEYKPLDKPVEQMTQEELEQRNRDAIERQANRKAVATGALPPPTAQQSYILAAQAASNATNPRNPLSNLIQTLTAGQ